jgi:glycosyltransferase involved in cell wall biosynthesis
VSFKTFNDVTEGKIMNKPKVSVIVPVYNTESYLRRCLDSVINQTLRDIEIICINDASLDNSIGILREYAAKDKRIKIIDFPENKGVSIARNAGIEIARGKYLGFVDSDDYIDKNFYEVLYGLIKKESADIAKGSVKVIDKRGISKVADNNKIISRNKYNFLVFFYSAIYNKDVIIKNDCKFVPRLVAGQDLTFIIQAVNNSNKVAITDDVFYSYVKREDSTTSTIYSIEKIQSSINVGNFIIDYINKMKISHEGYLITFSLCFNLLAFFPERASVTNRDRVRQTIAASLMNLYLKCKYKDEFIIYSKRYLSRFLKTNDIKGLTEYLKKSKKEQIFDDCRENVKFNLDSK